MGNLPASDKVRENCKRRRDDNIRSRLCAPSRRQKGHRLRDSHFTGYHWTYNRHRLHGDWRSKATCCADSAITYIRHSGRGCVRHSGHSAFRPRASGANGRRCMFSADRQKALFHPAYHLPLWLLQSQNPLLQRNTTARKNYRSKIHRKHF